MKILKQQATNCLAAVSLLFLPLGALAQSGPPTPPPDPYLQSYSFADTNWLSDLGSYPPIAFAHLVSVPLLDGNALQLDTTNSVPAFLEESVVDSGHTNVILATGAVGCIFINDWATADTNQLGAGPGDTAFLLASGDFSSGSPQGLWAIWADAAGQNLIFGGVSNSQTVTYASAPISWPANSIHLLGICYGDTNTTMFLDGQLAATGGPVTIIPPANSFFIGSDAQGYEQMQAIFYYLEFDTSAALAEFGPGYFTNQWVSLSNQFAPSQASPGSPADTGPPAPPGGSGTNGSGSNGPPYMISNPSYSLTTNYSKYTNFWLAAAVEGTNVLVSLNSTLSNLTYQILTNSALSTTNWGVWQTALATNSITPAPPLSLGSNALFFNAILVWESTGTNVLPDWWQMQYFGHLNVNPYADPDGDGLCNLDEYLLGTNPTNAHSISTLHTDAQALLLAYTNDPACHYHLSITNGATTNILLVTMWPTTNGTNYQIYSQSATNAPWIVETNFIGSNTSTTVAIALNGRTLSLIGGYGEDDDGDGLPSGYEVLATHTDPYLPDTGMTGTPDGYKDPDGDGYSNLQEYFNGTNPLVFDKPAAPTGLMVLVNNDGSTTVNWNASSGLVNEYVVYRDTGSGFVAVATNTSQTSFHDTSLGPGQNAYYEVQAIYSLGSSFLTASNANLYHPSYDLPMAIVNGPSNRLYLVASAPPPGVTNFAVTRTVYDVPWDFTGYPIIPARWGQEAYELPLLTTNGTFSIPATSLSNGMVQIPDAQAPPFGDYDFTVQPTGANGTYGDPVDCWGPSVGLELLSSEAGSIDLIPFMDGTAQLKENLSFLLTASTDNPFSCHWTDTYMYPYSQATNYVVASYYDSQFGLDQFMPFEDNYAYRNCVYSPTTATIDGFPPTGVTNDLFCMFMIPPTATYEFPTYNYAASSNLEAQITPLLSGANSQWVLDIDVYNSDEQCDIAQYLNRGLSCDNGVFSMNGTAQSYYGIPFASIQCVVNQSPLQFAQLSPTQCESPVVNTCFYTAVQTPGLRTVGYYFARFGEFVTGWWNFGYGTAYYTPYRDPMPEFSGFDVTNTTPLMIMPVGGQQIIAGYARQEITNGYTNMFAYVGQYFTNALVLSNGVVTTNTGGIVSEYGHFFATVPGQIALLTKPDPTQSNMQGQCEIDVIRLSLDVNHDGIMDESFTGHDNTSAQNPYVFWVNNDYDRNDYDGDDKTNYEDSVLSAGCPYTPTLATPDCSYRDASGNRIIPTKRDLEDFARLWVSGISPHVLTNLPSGSTITLSWAGTGSSPTIDLFAAADTNGGMGYLTNETIATQQTNITLCPYIGRLGPGGSIQLNASTFSNNWAGNYFIWCGCAFGSDQLNLTIADGSGNVLAQSSQYIQLQDIKQMYERWTVGDIPTIAPKTNVYPAEDNFSPGAPTTPFYYPYDPAYDTNDNYILYVHGWNMESWEKDRFAETAFKRLYWQGYQGRFGVFRWPTDYGFKGLGTVRTNIDELDNYDNSEFNAWRSALALNYKLEDLNSHYPGHVYLLAHSMGNVVAGEALRLEGSNQIVNTYVASQAAVPAHTYDTNVPDYSFDLTVGGFAYNLGPKVPNIYGNWFAGNYGGAAGNIMSFYNTNDFALARLHWQLNQLVKPDKGVLEGGTKWTYGYTGATNDPPPWNNFWKQTTPFFGSPTVTFFDIVHSLNDRYEVMAYAAQSYSTALGATPGVGNMRRTIDLTRVTSPIWPSDPNNYVAHFWHSAQFRGDNPLQGPYWNELLGSEAFNLK